MREEIREAAAEAATRPDIRAVIVYGGEEAFSAGADVAEMAPMSFADIRGAGAQISFALSSLAAIPKPVVAAVTRYALGGGLELALSCDRRVVSDDARLALPEIQLGIIPGGGGTQRLARVVGTARAKDMIFTGRHVRAAEALAIGLADQVVPRADVYRAAREWADQFAHGPAVALAAAKRAVDGGADLDLQRGLELETALFEPLFATEDRQTGMTAFIEQGPGKARFAGR